MQGGGAFAAAVAALTLSWGAAQAQMMDKRMGEGREMMAGAMAEMMGPELTRACFADLGDLGLSGDAQKSLSDKHYELQKKAIRGMAEIQVLRMDLARLLESRTFDLAAAQKAIGEISQRESELRSAHLAFLHDLGAALSDAQWTKLQEPQKRMKGGGMMPMMGGQGMMPMMGGQGMMQGGTGPTMQQQAPAKDGGHDAHHPAGPGAAEKTGDTK